MRRRTELLQALIQLRESTFFRCRIQADADRLAAQAAFTVYIVHVLVRVPRPPAPTVDEFSSARSSDSRPACRCRKDNAIENAGQKSETFRNNRLLIVTVFLASAVGLLIAPCLAILCLTTLLPLHGYTLSRVIWAVCYFVAAGFSFNSGTKLWRLAVGMIRPKATLDAEGVRFRMVSEKPADFQEQFVPWDQIAAIRHRRMGNNQFYSVVTKDNLVIAFDGLAFFRSRTLAQRISARAGIAIEELK